MDETSTFVRFIEHLSDRVSGPLKFRFLLQPTMATIFAVIDGLRDAREGNVPYFWSMLSDREHRRDIIKDGWKSVGKVFILALVLDAVYQFFVLGFFYPVEALVVAFALAILPYLILRGLVTRIARLKK
jgi:hypothetical protein